MTAMPAARLWVEPPNKVLPDSDVYTSPDHQKILEEALLLFADQGLPAADVKEMAKAKRLSSTMTEQQLDSKEDLLCQLFQLGHEELSQRFHDALRSAGLDPVRQIRGLVRAQVEMHATFPLLTRVVDRELERLGPESRSRIDYLREEHVAMFAEVIRRGVRSGIFRVDDLWLVTVATSSIAAQVADRWPEFEGYSIEEVADEFGNLAVRMVISFV